MDQIINLISLIVLQIFWIVAFVAVVGSAGWFFGNWYDRKFLGGK